MLVIPPGQLDPQILTALIEDFVTRDGAVHGHHDVTMDSQIASVRRQLETGKAQIIYEEEDESWTILQKDR